MKRHPPSGRPIDARVFQSGDAAARWSPVTTRYYDSGTSALAIALREALAADAAASKDVVLPAYACPNLAAAAAFAGARHRFVDFEPGGSTPAVDATAGIDIAVDFCGVPSARIGPATIHDMAQSHAPFLADWTPRARRTVVSFGRAKPVSLTMGGALLGDAGSASASAQAVAAASLQRRAWIYNLSLDPRMFGVLARMPFLGIGATRYEPLADARVLEGDFPTLATAAVQEFRRNSREAFEGTRRALQFATDAGLAVPFDTGRLPAGLPLWRMPVLLEDETQADAFAAAAASMGVSRLYRRTMPEFLGVDANEAKERWPHAWQLSRTLVTLPTHGRLDEASWQRLGRLLKENKNKRSAP
jgi:hypothetical protein